jgi:alpha/beta hydrolase family protein
VTDHETGVRQLLAELNANPAGDPFGLVRAQLQNQLDQDLSIERTLDQIGPGQPPVPVYLLAYDPKGHDGQTGVAISYGNPDTAANTGVVVPGTGHSALDLESVGRNGRDLFNAMGSSSKAVVVWLDGPEPPDLPHAGLDSYANDGAPNLVTDIAGLRAAHGAASGDDGHLTAIGHSYGSYILGKAAAQGADVDDVIFVGSPGVGVDSASDLGVDPAHVWDGQAGDDPILFTQRRFTPDPLTGNNPQEGDFGAQHFDVSGSHGHSDYYKHESLLNMARIADGNYAAVDRVDAPDYRGLRELPMDALATGLDPLYTQTHVTVDLLTGHPVRAVEDAWDGGVETVKDGWHTVEDVGEAVWPF